MQTRNVEWAEVEPSSFGSIQLARGPERRRIWVRRCRCGRLDLREQWSSPGEADRDGVWRRPWKCPECGGTVFDLAVIEDERRTRIPDVFLQHW